ncbi:MAG: alkaline phosphatase, partial [Deltaproteobacteria bacterium]
MVEGSQIDSACHPNDPARLLSDMLAYDNAVQAARCGERIHVLNVGKRVSSQRPQSTQRTFVLWDR